MLVEKGLFCVAAAELLFEEEVYLAWMVLKSLLRR